MKSNGIAYPKWASWAGPAALLAVAGLAALWLWLTHGAYVPLRSAVGPLVLMAVLSAVWFYRIRAARRLFAALDTYAERELDRRQRRLRTSSRKSIRALSRSNV